MNHLLVSLVLMHLAAGVFGGTYEEMSVMEGHSVTLHIKPDEIQRAEKLLWKFNGNEPSIAKINTESKTSSVPGNQDGRFKDRLKLNNQTGDLTITDMRSTDSGLYQLDIIGTKDSYKKFNVTVTASEPDQRSHWVITGPVLVVGLMLLGGFFIIYKRCKNTETEPVYSGNPQEINEIYDQMKKLNADSLPASDHIYEQCSDDEKETGVPLK